MTPQINSLRFRLSDLRDPVGLIDDLRDAADELSASPLNRYLRERLSSEALQKVDKYNRDDPPPPDEQRAIEQAIVDLFNRILEGEGIYNEENLIPLELLSEETKKLLEETRQDKSLQGETLAQRNILLNRLLLEAAYGRKIATSYFRIVLSPDYLAIEHDFLQNHAKTIQEKLVAAGEEMLYWKGHHAEDSASPKQCRIYSGPTFLVSTNAFI